MAPSPTAPFLEWVYNSDWKGAPIQQDNKFDENQPSWMLPYKGTPEWMVNMNKKANALTNDVAPDNEYAKGNDSWMKLPILLPYTISTEVIWAVLLHLWSELAVGSLLIL